MTPQQRLTRMRRMFDKKRAVLREDYDFFAGARVTIPPKAKKKRRGK
jgi:hypothetical protein